MKALKPHRQDADQASSKDSYGCPYTMTGRVSVLMDFGLGSGAGGGWACDPILI